MGLRWAPGALPSGVSTRRSHWYFINFGDSSRFLAPLKKLFAVTFCHVQAAFETCTTCELKPIKLPFWIFPSKLTHLSRVRNLIVIHLFALTVLHVTLDIINRRQLLGNFKTELFTPKPVKRQFQKQCGKQKPASSFRKASFSRKRAPANNTSAEVNKTLARAHRCFDKKYKFNSLCVCAINQVFMRDNAWKFSS